MLLSLATVLGQDIYLGEGSIVNNAFKSLFQVALIISNLGGIFY